MIRYFDARIEQVIQMALKSRSSLFLLPLAQMTQGFPAYYDDCRPGDIKRIAQSEPSHR